MPPTSHRAEARAPHQLAPGFFPRAAAVIAAFDSRAGQSSEKAAPVYQHSDEDRSREAAAGLDDLVRAERAKHHTDERAHLREEPSAG
ncbi:hypothetical protein [Streptomyces glaucescens]|uniref:hypothetical protein n=1 Tax=Streptomyces glaucescens TaxID=1907 RepID=UPI001FCC16C2|nr:hypothetical protein [Streptomyces glaucescens]